MDNLTQVLVALDDVTVRQHGEVVFQDTSFVVRRGEHWALTGNDEQGRSALIETIAGKLPIAAGNVLYPFQEEFQRRNPVQSPPGSWHKPISLVSSRHNFSSLSRTEELFYQQRYNATAADDSPTVEEHLAEVKPYMDNPIWTFERTVAALNLHSLLDRRLIKLSNGETRRVLLAEALLRNPAILLLENPLVGLDVGMRQELNKLISSIAQSGITLVMVTGPGEVPDAITHIAVWDKGEEIQAMPKDAFRRGDSSTHRPVKADITEIQELLADPVSPSFDIVVGMEDVTVKYGEKTVLDHINWNVRQGERWALVGHNGAGKTTLLSLINADNPQAYANRVTLFDRRRGSGESIWDIKRHIGFVSPELFQYFPGSEPCEHVIESGFYDAVGLNRKSHPAKQARVLRWMQLLHMESLAGKPYRQVSVSGQRLCLLARALVKNPPLLILDEPCQGFDSRQQEHFKSVVDAICASSNLTLIYVSHYQHEIPESVQNVMHLENGKARIEKAVCVQG
ncbi:ATP-binding cassette domain-containing protein [Pontibacter russatus]|uniref:ATP-binding cassette domain-containing protein n=1 Tax=Pontibacter russatus TaxID=2694929 RepID=UPI0013793B51|nr:ATP-binding cassette domain-containing protein [Pontibacter russatus]